MSYLVDALKKAERERHEQRGADIQSVSAEGPPQGGTARALRWVVIGLVVCNLGLLLYVLWPGSGDMQTGSSTMARTMPDTKLKSPQDNAIADSSSLPVESEPQPSQTTANRAATPRRQVPSNGRDAKRPTAEQARASSAAPGAEQGARGQVTFSQSPLDGGAQLRPSIREQAPSMQAFGGRVPEVEINGHLYSSVPGRSFILVNGRRYHEGERMAAGPAVESIDAGGATLNYRGQRYHVAGPG